MAGLTLDAGALIAYERADARMREILATAFARGIVPTVPSAVIAETWRGDAKDARVARLLKACVVEPLDERRAREAGALRAAAPAPARSTRASQPEPGGGVMPWRHPTLGTWNACSDRARRSCSCSGGPELGQGHRGHLRGSLAPAPPRPNHEGATLRSPSTLPDTMDLWARAAIAVTL